MASIVGAPSSSVPNIVALSSRFRLNVDVGENVLNTVGLIVQIPDVDCTPPVSECANLGIENNRQVLLQHLSKLSSEP